eukprot:c26018_g1_i1 orf=530-2434(-)
MLLYWAVWPGVGRWFGASFRSVWRYHGMGGFFLCSGSGRFGLSLRENARNWPWQGQGVSMSSSSFPERESEQSPSRRRSAVHQSGVLYQYNSLVASGVLQQDEQQQKLAFAMEELLEQMKSYEKEMQQYHVKLREWETARQQLRQQKLRESAVFEDQHQLQNISNGEKWGVFSKWFSRRRGGKHVERGAGRMVARIKREKEIDLLVGPRPVLPLGPQGLYIYGSVGCGKTMMMDMLFNAADGVVTYCRRLHFHAGMLEVHACMHKLWKKNSKNKMTMEMLKVDCDISDKVEPLRLERDVTDWLVAEERLEQDLNSNTTILDEVAESLLGDTENNGGASLLCFDEMQVADVFTAVALAGILGRLFKKGTIIVATSNRAPNELNKDGMQKQLFDKLIEALEHHCRLILLGTEDYRRVLASSTFEMVNFFCPLNSQSERLLEDRWTKYVKQAGGRIISVILPVMFGRVLKVQQCCNGAARFSFEELCDHPVGAADYIALSQSFHTVFITGIPVMSMRNRDKARRFITLIDELYNHHRQMICTAASSIDELFLGTEEGPLVDLESVQFETEVEDSRLRRNVLSLGNVAPLAVSTEHRTSIQSLFSGREELFAFQRAMSRLIEMQTQVYLQGLDIYGCR